MQFIYKQSNNYLSLKISVYEISGRDRDRLVVFRNYIYLNSYDNLWVPYFLPNNFVYGSISWAKEEELRRNDLLYWLYISNPYPLNSKEWLEEERYRKADLLKKTQEDIRMFNLVLLLNNFWISQKFEEPFSFRYLYYAKILSFFFNRTSYKFFYSELRRDLLNSQLGMILFEKAVFYKNYYNNLLQVPVSKLGFHESKNTVFLFNMWDFPLYLRSVSPFFYYISVFDLLDFINKDVKREKVVLSDIEKGIWTGPTYIEPYVEAKLSFRKVLKRRLREGFNNFRRYIYGSVYVIDTNHILFLLKKNNYHWDFLTNKKEYFYKKYEDLMISRSFEFKDELLNRNSIALKIRLYSDEVVLGFDDPGIYKRKKKIIFDNMLFLYREFFEKRIFEVRLFLKANRDEKLFFSDQFYFFHDVFDKQHEFLDHFFQAMDSQVSFFYEYLVRVSFEIQLRSYYYFFYKDLFMRINFLYLIDVSVNNLFYKCNFHLFFVVDSLLKKVFMKNKISVSNSFLLESKNFKEILSFNYSFYNNFFQQKIVRMRERGSFSLAFNSYFYFLKLMFFVSLNLFSHSSLNMNPQISLVWYKSSFSYNNRFYPLYYDQVLSNYYLVSTSFENDELYSTEDRLLFKFKYYSPRIRKYKVSLYNNFNADRGILQFHDQFTDFDQFNLYFKMMVSSYKFLKVIDLFDEKFSESVSLKWSILYSRLLAFVRYRRL